MTNNMTAYRQLVALSGSEFGRWIEDPEELIHARTTQIEATDAMQKGSLLHSLILEPHKVSEEYIKAPEGLRRDKRAIEYKQFLKIAAERMTVPHKDWQEAQAMADRILTTPKAFEILKHCKGKNELELAWEEQGVLCKGKPDRYLEELNLVIDIKTCQTVNKRKFWWKVCDFGYQLQLAHYMAGIKHTYNKAAYPGALIVAVKNVAPYTVKCYSLGIDMLSEAMQERERIITDYKQCMETGIWNPDADRIIELMKE